MAHVPPVQLLELETVRDLLRINPEDLQWLINTRQLPLVTIRGQQRVDTQDLIRFVETYKNIQNRSIQ